MAFLILLFTAVIGIISVLYLFVKFVSHAYWYRHGVFQFPQTFPTGMAWPLFWEQQHMGDFLHDIYLRMRSENLKIAGFYLFTKPVLMITDPEHIQHVLATDFNHFRGRGIWCDEEIDPLSGNLLSLPPEKWKVIRSKLSPFFSPNSMKTILPSMTSCGPSLIKVTGQYADNNESFDIKDLIWRFSSTILGSCVFGYECNTMENPNDQVKLVGKAIFEPDKLNAFKRVLFFLMPEFLKLFKISSNSEFVTDFFLNLVKQTIAYREGNDVNRADLMQILINLRKKDNTDPNSKGLEDGLTVNEIAAQCWVFFAGGFESAASLVTFCMFELSKNPDIQDKLRDEVHNVLEKHEGKFTYEALHDMKYTEKVIKETLRKYPSLTFLNRECTSESYTFPNSEITVRKGDAVVISLLGIHRDAEYYPEPEKFNPERFNEDNVINPYTNLSFGEGPRNCIALKMGLLQGIFTIALLISEFKFHFSEKTKLPLKMCKNTFTLCIDGGIWLKAERIKDSTS